MCPLRLRLRLPLAPLRLRLPLAPLQLPMQLWFCAFCCGRGFLLRPLFSAGGRVSAGCLLLVWLSALKAAAAAAEAPPAWQHVGLHLRLAQQHWVVADEALPVATGRRLSPLGFAELHWVVAE